MRDNWHLMNISGMPRPLWRFTLQSYVITQQSLGRGGHEMPIILTQV